MLNFEKVISKIKKNPIVSAGILVVTVVMTISSFTDSAKNIWNLIPRHRTYADVAGNWQADVIYDWARDPMQESFSFKVEGEDVQGTASFLRVKRQILSGKRDETTITFDTQSKEMSSDAELNTVHHYVGTFADGEIRFAMLTTGGSSEHLAIHFVARKVAVQ